MRIPMPISWRTRREALVVTAALAGFLPVVLAKSSKHEEDAKCPGSFDMQGYGKVQMVPTGWENMEVLDGGVVSPQMGGRAYFADTCTAGKFDNEQYVALNLLGKTMSFTADVSGAGCGCNAALYLTSMRQNTEPSDCLDYYCDANDVCGVSCAEIDIMEGNMHAFHSTLHSAHDHDGKGVGYGGGSDSSYGGWNGPRQWTADQYGPDGRCIDTHKPFQVSVSFPTDQQGSLDAMDVVLTQEGKDCPLAVTITNYNGNSELTSALAQGMTPIVSYWSDEGMLWLDGEGADHKGPCHRDHPGNCGESVKFYDFAIEKIGGGAVTREDLKSASNVISVPAPAKQSTTTAWWQAPTTTGWWEAPTTTTQVPWWQAPTSTEAVFTDASPAPTPAWTPAPTSAPTPAPQTQPPTTTTPAVQLSWNGYIQVGNCDCAWLDHDNCADQGGCAKDCRRANSDPRECVAKAAKQREADAAAEKLLAEKQRVSKAEAEAQRVEEAKLAAKKSAAMQVALAKAKEEEEHPSLTANTCFREGGQFSPINMEDEPRSVEVDASACQDRCSRTLGCARFTYWHADGGCHLQDSDAKWEDGDQAGVITGPASCKADAYCHEYIGEMGCGWTINHNCAGQIPGEIGLAHDDGTRGYECCCKYQMWKNDKEASKRGIPEAPEEKKDAPILCTASHGHAVGDEVCCEQEGFVQHESHVCPKNRPTCVGLVAHKTWGTCQVAEGWQQCGGIKDGKPWWGPTSCTEGYVCKEWSKDYSQCYKQDTSIIMMDSVLKIGSLFHNRVLAGSPLMMLCAALLFVVLFAKIALWRRHQQQQAAPANLTRMLHRAPQSETPALPMRSRPSADRLLESTAELAV